MDKQKVVEKVRKLLNMTGGAGASDAEAQTAMELAHRIMAKHHVTLDDLDHAPADDFAKVDASEQDLFRCYVGRRIFAWESRLCMFVSEFVGVSTYMDPELRVVRKNGLAVFGDDEEPVYGATIVFFGVAEDAAIAKELYDELRMLIAAMAVAKFASVYKGDGAAYCEGFVTGLFMRLRKAQRLEQEQATTGGVHQAGQLALIKRRTEIITYKKEAAVKWLFKSKGIKLRRGAGKAGSRRGSAEARQEGIMDGRTTDVTATRRKKIGG